MSNDEEAAADLALADESLTELGKLVHETRLANLIAVAKGVKLSSAGSGLSAQQLLEGEGRRILIQTYRAFEDVFRGTRERGQASRGGHGQQDDDAALHDQPRKNND